MANSDKPTVAGRVVGMAVSFMVLFGFFYIASKGWEAGKK